MVPPSLLGGTICGFTTIKLIIDTAANHADWSAVISADSAIQQAMRTQMHLSNHFRLILRSIKPHKGASVRNKQKSSLFHKIRSILSA
jgi:hypothetical protein